MPARVAGSFNYAAMEVCASGCPCLPATGTTDSSLRLVRLRDRPTDDAGHVGAILLLLLEEGLVLVGDSGLLLALDRRQCLVALGFGGVLGLGALDSVGRLLHRLALRLLLGDRRRCSRRQPCRGHRHLVDGAADGTGDRIAVEIVKSRATLGVLAGTLGATFGFGGHGSIRLEVAIWRLNCHAASSVSKANRRRGATPAAAPWANERL